ncbi:hypothetical protein [Aquimarina pacifica]|uniref:hypothetical protein n=1 Tax=Aquimarina pacifica TaxID=1296415 RepID=UPI0004709697|nr:hypothetical protein [Aquimarina pacifica]
MKKELLYKIAITILLVLNIIQIGNTPLTKKPPQKHNPHHKPNAIEILHLDQKQDQEFKEIGRKHGEVMSLLRNEQKQYVQNYFLTPSDSLLDHIKEIEAKKIKITEEHFEAMKSILNNEQKPHYKNFKEKAIDYILR